MSGHRNIIAVLVVIFAIVAIPIVSLANPGMSGKSSFARWKTVSSPQHSGSTMLRKMKPMRIMKSSMQSMDLLETMEDINIMDFDMDDSGSMKKKDMKRKKLKRGGSMPTSKMSRSTRPMEETKSSMEPSMDKKMKKKMKKRMTKEMQDEPAVVMPTQEKPKVEKENQMDNDMGN